MKESAINHGTRTHSATRNGLWAVTIAILAVNLIFLAVLVGGTACTPCWTRPCASELESVAGTDASTPLEDDPVDAVVLWVRTDAAWQRARDKAAKQITDDSPLASNSNNFEAARLTPNPTRKELHQTNKEEAYYAIVAAARNMPWLRQIILVTQDGQVPNWFGEVCTTAAPTPVRLVHHSEYVPPDVLPTFSSDAIEAHLHRLDRLANKFVLFSDDMQVLKPVDRSYFFARNGNAIVRGETAWKESQLFTFALGVCYEVSARFNGYSRSVANMMRDIRRRTASGVPLINYHHPRSCSKTMLSCANRELGQDEESTYSITLRAPLRAKRGCPAIWTARTLALMRGDAQLAARDDMRLLSQFVDGISDVAYARVLRVLRRHVPDSLIPTFLCVNSVPGQSEDKMAEYLDHLRLYHA